MEDDVYFIGNTENLSDILQGKYINPQVHINKPMNIYAVLGIPPTYTMPQSV